MDTVPIGKTLAQTDAAAVLRRLGGHATTAQLRRHVAWHLIRRAVSEGNIRRAGRGRYVLPELPAWKRVATRVRGVLSHSSAAQAFGLGMLLPADRLHLTVPHGAKPPALTRVTYHWRDLATSEVSGTTTSLVRTVLDCAASLPFAEGLAVADSALRSGHVSRGRLQEALVGARMHGVAAARSVVAAADPGAANPFESGLRAALLSAGVLGFATQVVIRTPLLTARVDLADRARRIVVEADSFTHHGATRADFAEDCRRYNELVRAGWTVLRFSWEDVMFHPELVGRTVRDVQRRLAATQRRQGRARSA